MQLYYEIKKQIFSSNAFISEIAIDFFILFLFNNNHNKTHYNFKVIFNKSKSVEMRHMKIQVERYLNLCTLSVYWKMFELVIFIFFLIIIISKYSYLSHLVKISEFFIYCIYHKKICNFSIFPPKLFSYMEQCKSHMDYCYGALLSFLKSDNP